MQPDVLVIGGGPAGLACAIAAAGTGARVEVAEPRSGAIDKCCGEGLLPGAAAALRVLGIDAAEYGHPLAGIAFLRNGERAEARFATPAFGVRRTGLHGALRARACDVGVQLTTAGARLAPDFQRSRRVCLSDGTKRYPEWVAGADGMQSAVRAAAGLDAGHTVSRRFALRRHFRLAAGVPVPEYVEVYWARGAQAYVTPVTSREVGVAVVMDSKPAGMEKVLAQFPALTAWLRDSVPCSTPWGAVTLHRTLRTPIIGKVALVGDASGSVDAVTGDGLTLSFSQALALAQALAAGDPASYARAHLATMRLPRLMSRALLFMGSRPAITQASVALLARAPGLFPALLRLHTRMPHPTTEQEAVPWLAHT